MPWYPCRFPVCRTERSGRFEGRNRRSRVSTAGRTLCRHKPAGHGEGRAAAPGFPVTGAGAYAKPPEGLRLAAHAWHGPRSASGHRSRARALRRWQRCWRQSRYAWRRVRPAACWRCARALEVLRPFSRVVRVRHAPRADFGANSALSSVAAPTGASVLCSRQTVPNMAVAIPTTADSTAPLLGVRNHAIDTSTSEAHHALGTTRRWSFGLS